MANRGRPRKPLALKVLSGERKPSRLGLDQPAPLVAEPQRSDYMDPLAVEVWDRLVPELLGMHVLTRADGLALEVLCELAADFRKNVAIYQTAVIERGRLANDPEKPSGFLDRKTAHSHAGRSARLLLDYLREFGLTPSARARVKALEGAGRDELAAFLTDVEKLA